MPDFLIDANLPLKVKTWQDDRFVHVLNIDPAWNDDAIWQYALDNHLTIISKDKDFLVQQILKGSPPKVIHIKLGNLKLNDFISTIENCWSEVELLLSSYTLINIYSDKIEAIR
jgi:predicted nuclease of predicted toxin-antitoxin system